MMQKIVGKIKFIGNSDVTLAKKYDDASYIPLFISLKNTGLSSGNTKIKLYTVKKAFEANTKNTPPFLVEVPLLVPSIVWKAPQVTQAIMIIMAILTYEVSGSLNVFKIFL